MSEPCTEKDNIAKLFDFHEVKMEKLHNMELRQISIQGDVAEIKGKINNGMTIQINKVHDIVTELAPVIKHHETVIANIENMGWWLSRIFFTALAGVLIWAISKGFMPHV